MSKEIRKFLLSSEDVKIVMDCNASCVRLMEFFGANSQPFKDGQRVMTEVWRRLAWSYGFDHTNATLKRNILYAIGEAMEWDETNKIWA